MALAFGAVFSLPLVPVGGSSLCSGRPTFHSSAPPFGSEEASTYFAAMRVAKVVTFVGFAVDTVAIVSRPYHDDHSLLQRTAPMLARWSFSGPASHRHSVRRSLRPPPFRNLWMRRHVVYHTGLQPSILTALRVHG